MTLTSSAITVEVYLEDEFSDSSSEKDWSSCYWADHLPPWSQVWLEALSSDLPLATGYEFTVRLTGDREIQQFNAQYRQQDKPTDVLSFPTLEVSAPAIAADDDEPFYLGDILISVETAKRQAAEQNHSLDEEIGWLITHGLLHLLGWDHPDEAHLQDMLLQQETLLRLVGLLAQPP
jgi:probable rRNA maturation factor